MTRPNCENTDLAKSTEFVQVFYKNRETREGRSEVVSTSTRVCTVCDNHARVVGNGTRLAKHKVA